MILFLEPGAVVLRRMLGENDTSVGSESESESLYYFQYIAIAEQWEMLNRNSVSVLSLVSDASAKFKA